MRPHKRTMQALLLLAIVVLAIWLLRQNTQSSASEFFFQGTTMGKIVYTVKYIAPDGDSSLDYSVDSLLKAFNRSLSTYDPNSEISRFNRSDSIFEFESELFLPVLKKSLEIVKASGGAFDPTVMPLVNYWGFGPAQISDPDTNKVAELLKLVGFESYIRFDEKSVTKLKKGVQLDFSAIAKGYAVDLVAQLLLSKKIENFMVEIGGEAVCRGRNRKGKPWTLGITNPEYKTAGQSKSTAVIELENKAIATSGNYERFYIRDGKKYAHTIDPKTGYPVEHNLLSATVVADDCMTADAWATAFMVMGLEKAKQILKQNPQIQGFFIYDEQGQIKTFATSGLDWYVYQ